MKVKGFTLIELLVVISIIGILTTLVMVNLNAARERARDTQRKSDLSNIQTALRLYYNDVGSFPASSSDGKIKGCGTPAGSANCTWGAEWTVGGTTYMKLLPQDPLGAEGGYKYTGAVDTESYTLEACLENKSDQKGIPVATSVCSSGVIYRVLQ
jgi:general secretion pathway protein G